MKRLTLLFIMLIGIGTGYCQEDLQWYLNQDDAVGSEVLMSPIYKPNDPYALSTTNPPDDDIFIIFEDGSYYNSRYLRNKNLQYNDNGKFILRNVTNPTSRIRFLYWTNKYDGNGSPPNLQPPPSGGNLNVNDIIANKNLSDNLNENEDGNFNNNLQAVHTAVPGTDNTLIIDNILQGENILEVDLEQNGSYFPLPPDAVMLQNFPNHNLSTINCEAEIMQGKENTFTTLSSQNNNNTSYINLRMGDILSNYINANETFKLRFQIKNQNDEVIATHEETIADSNDPNELVATHFCKKSDGYYVYYDGKFFNESTTEAADSIKFGFTTMPEFNAEVMAINLCNVTYRDTDILNQVSTSSLINETEFEVTMKENFSIISDIEREVYLYFSLCFGPFDNINDVTNKTHLVRNAYTHFGDKVFKMPVKSRLVDTKASLDAGSEYYYDKNIKEINCTCCKPKPKPKSFIELIIDYLRKYWFILIVIILIPIVLRRRRSIQK